MDLKKLHNNAMANAARQRRKLKAGKNIRVMPEFWERVASAKTVDEYDKLIRDTDRKT